MFKKYLVITTAADLVRIAPEKIVYISSDGNYSNMVQTDNETRLLTYQLGQIEELLPKTRLFLRRPRRKEAISSVNILWWTTPTLSRTNPRARPSGGPCATVTGRFSPLKPLPQNPSTTSPRLWSTLAWTMPFIWLAPTLTAGQPTARVRVMNLATPIPILPRSGEISVTW